jgi:hypothetical protein
MRSSIVLLFVAYSSICLAQTDSMFVEKMDGTIRGYPISVINQIYFFGEPINVREQELVQTVLSSFTVSQNFPNPFNPSTTIQYNVPKAGNVEVKIFDIQGRLVRSLVKSYQQAGAHSLIWDSRSSTGLTVSSGTYLCQVMFDGSALIKKLVLIK